MRKRRIVLVAGILLAAVAYTASPAFPNGRSLQDPPAQAPPFDQEAALRKLRESIAGRENKPAGEVFKNVTQMKDIPAGRLLAVMAMGYGRSLGVDCTHCHVPDRWESDEKPAKGIAREMRTMTNAINADYLKRLEGLKNRNAVVNCTTCHRGQLKPALDLR